MVRKLCVGVGGGGGGGVDQCLDEFHLAFGGLPVYYLHE